MNKKLKKNLNSFVKMNKEIWDSKDVCYYGHASKFARREIILYTKPFFCCLADLDINVYLFFSNDFAICVCKL